MFIALRIHRAAFSRARRVNQLCYKTAERARVTVS